MKRFILVLIIAFILPILGCGSQSKSENMGRFVEKQDTDMQMDTNEKEISRYVDNNGHVVVYTEKKDLLKTEVFKYTKIGDYYDKIQIHSLDSYFKAGYNFVSSVLGEDGKEYIMMDKTTYVDSFGKELDESDLITNVYTNSEEIMQEIVDKSNNYDQLMEQILICDGKEVTPSVWVKDKNQVGTRYQYVEKYYVTLDGMLIYYNGYTGELVKYDFKTKEVTKIFESGKILAWTIKDNTIYIAGKELNASDTNSTIYVYDSRTVTCKKTISTQIDFSRIKSPVFNIDREDNIYVLNKDGLYFYAAKGSLWEEKFTGEDFLFGSPSMTINQLVIDYSMENGFFISMLDNQSFKTTTYKYYYDLNTPTSPSNEIVIYSLWNIPLLQEAARRYENANPDVSISIKIADSTSNYTDRLKELNASVLNGNSADIIITDGLPMDVFKKKDVLTDLSDIVDLDNISDNVAAAYVDNGSCYTLPVKISVPMVYSYLDLGRALKSTGDLCDYSQCQNGLYFCYTNLKELTERLLYSYYNEIVDANGEVNSDKLYMFLENVKAIYMCTNTNVPFTGDLDNVGTRSNSIYPYSAKYVGDWIGGAAFGNTSSTVDMSVFYSLHDLRNINYFTINNKYISNGSIAINSNSDEPGIAEDFVSYLFSDEIQELDFYDGYPVTKTALEYWKNNNTGSTNFDAYLSSYGKYKMYLIKQNSTERQNNVMNLVEGAKNAIITDDTIISIITSEVDDRFIYNKNETDYIVNQIMNKIKSYKDSLN